jgi:hypothetical protein
MHFPTVSYAIFNPVLAAVQIASWKWKFSSDWTAESFHALNTKVVRNIVMTVLTKIQHLCMRVMRVTKILMSVSLLPGQIGRVSQIGFFGHANLEIRCGVEYQLWSTWNHTPIDQDWKFLSDWPVGYEIFLMIVLLQNFEKLARMSFCHACFTLVISF